MVTRHRTFAKSDRKIRYAVVGLGHIAQAAVLPAFGHAANNSVLAGLVSGDSQKLKALGRKYRVDRLSSYDEYDDLLSSGEIDAVYIALPNDLHKEFAVRAARRGVHILCEKPLASTRRECRSMIAAAEKQGVKLMTAYRLHFEEANLRAIKIASSGKLGELRYFESSFSQDVRPGDIRLDPKKGGGPLYDIGVYCINAARYIFRDEPTEAWATSESRPDRRFAEVPEMVSAVLRFPGNRLASFTCSFGAAGVSSYRIVGTRGDLLVEPAYGYAVTLEHHLTIGDRTQDTKFLRRDQFAPEILYFSDCILQDREPEPSGEEGMIDVAIVEALEKSIRSGRMVRLDLEDKGRRADLRQEAHRPAVQEPKVVNAEPPTRT